MRGSLEAAPHCVESHNTFPAYLLAIVSARESVKVIGVPAATTTSRYP